MSSRALAPSVHSKSLFAIWGWAMLFIVALSAMPNGGQPRTRLIGSAFDPTTTSVALSPKPVKAKRSMPQATGRDLPGTLPAALPAMPGAVLASLPFLLPRHAGVFAAPDSRDRPRSLTRAHGARAPPAR